MRRNPTNLPRTIAAATITLACAAPLANAQLTDIDPPRWVTITQPTELRCAPGSIWYPVAALDAGITLSADAAQEGWLRVHYPDDTPALALARNATLDTETRTVTITRRTGLRALNLNYPGLETSFKPLFSQDLPPVGTTLDYLGSITDDQGNPVAFRVRAPQNAKGFVLESATRPATRAEIQAASSEDPDTQASNPSRDRAQQRVEDALAERQPDQPTPDAESQPDTPAEAAPDDLPTTTATVPETTMGDQPDTPATPRDRLARVFSTLRALDAQFDAVRAQPAGASEAESLIREYQRVAQLAQPTAAAEQVRQHTDARVTILEIRLEVLDAIRDIDAAQLSASEADQRLDRLARSFDAPIAYTAVGKLAPSSVYTGNAGIPLRFRLQLGDSASARTVAYIEPTEDFSPETLQTLIGVRVGITGPATATKGTAIPLITPDILEALEPTDPQSTS